MCGTQCQRMFCSTQDVLTNITEKTKLLAQKCAHLRANVNCKTTIGDYHGIVDDDAIIADADTIVPPSNVLHSPDGMRKDSRCWLGNGDHSHPACFCAIAGSLRLKLRKTLFDANDDGGSTTRWYVKVSITRERERE